MGLARWLAVAMLVTSVDAWVRAFVVDLVEDTREMITDARDYLATAQDVLDAILQATRALIGR